MTGFVEVAAIGFLLSRYLCRSPPPKLRSWTQRALKFLGTTETDTLVAVIEALTLAIGARDRTGMFHSRRISVFASGLARISGMTEVEIKAVEMAALLHDVGKIAVPVGILLKPGPLTQEEFQKIRIHSQVGAEIIAGVPFPYPVAPLILNHHERWGGKGYPAGINGEEIPKGARILAVVDYFEALTSDRPHHRALSTEDALSVLWKEAGKALDPELVQKFVHNIPTLEAEAARMSEGIGTATATTEKTVINAIGLADREIYLLCEIAQVMGTTLGVADTMALLCSKLSDLVPMSSCALFLHNEEKDTLRCRYATGIDAEILQRVSVKTGLGLTGWVARNRRTLVNARPSADLEAAGISGTTALQSALVCPLVFNDRLVGTLSLYHLDAGCFTDDHRRLLDRVCEQLAAVIYNSIVFEQTQEDRLTDSLTGLPNIHFMFMHLTREFARAERLRSEVSLLVARLDNSEQLLDTYGQCARDRALTEISDGLRAATRPCDIVVHYGGGEFIVVLSGCGAEEAALKKTELQSAVNDLQFEPIAGKQLKLSISTGIAVFPHDGETYEKLIDIAYERARVDKLRRRELLPGAHPRVH